MPQPRRTGSNLLFAVLTVSAFLTSGIVAASAKCATQQGHLIPPEKSQAYPIGFKIMSSTEGVDFMPYLATLDAPIGHTFLAKKPNAATEGGKGYVVVGAHIQKDGSLADGSVIIVSSSENEDIDAAALSAVRSAAPFKPLPEKYLGAYLDLHFILYYNKKARGAEPKPKVVPIEGDASHAMLFCAPRQMNESRQSGGHGAGSAQVSRNS